MAKQDPKLKARRDKANKRVQNAAEVILENIAGQKVGRPAKYHDGFCHIAEQAEIIGCTNVDLAEMFGCSTDAINGWLITIKSFSNAVLRGRANTDRRIEASLRRAAEGYSHPETQIVLEGQGAGVSRARQIQITKHYAPDTRAAQFWLNNRRPQDWRPNPLLKPIGETPQDAAALLREQLAQMDNATQGNE